jgi:hypothetical protein
VAWTTADRDAVKAAIVALATGARTVTVTVADRTVSYQAADLTALREVLAMIEADLAAVADPPRPRQYLLYGSKGTE